MYLLGIEATISLNLETKKEEPMMVRKVSKDIYDWLLEHDIEYTAEGKRVFICNKVRYIDLGPDFSTEDKTIKF